MVLTPQQVTQRIQPTVSFQVTETMEVKGAPNHTAARIQLQANSWDTPALLGLEIKIWRENKLIERHTHVTTNPDGNHEAVVLLPNQENK